jgi:hypothetical protein
MSVGSIPAIISGMSTILSIVGDFTTSRREAARQKYIQEINLRNVQIAEQEAVREEELAHIAAGEKEQEGVRARQLMRAQLASRGVDVNVGTGIDDQIAVLFLAQQAARDERFKGAERARARIAQAAGYSQEASLAGFSAESARTKGHFDIAGTLIESKTLTTGLESVAEKWGVFSA